MTTKELVVKTNATPDIENVLKVAVYKDHSKDFKPDAPRHGNRSAGGFNCYDTDLR